MKASDSIAIGKAHLAKYAWVQINMYIGYSCSCKNANRNETY